jgi:hypothetical protein
MLARTIDATQRMFAHDKFRYVHEIATKTSMAACLKSVGGSEIGALLWFERGLSWPE